MDPTASRLVAIAPSALSNHSEQSQLHSEAMSDASSNNISTRSLESINSRSPRFKRNNNSFHSEKSI